MYDHVSELIWRFQRAFDHHDWKGLRECLDDEVFIDYSSFRGTEPAHVLAEVYVQMRRHALSDLMMQHSHSNLVLSPGSHGLVSAKCDYQIKRFEREGGRHFHSWGTYNFEWVRRHTGWKICSIIQHLLRTEGDPAIHGAMRPPPEVGPSQ